MSDKFFYNKFSNALTDILDQIQIENFPSEINMGKMISEKWSGKDTLNYIVGLYIKYINLLRNVEDAYDQTVHPQLRKYILKFLENILCRTVQIKKELIFYNNPILDLPGIPYVFLDDYIIDLKLEPRDLDLIIPRYFRENESKLTKERRAILDIRLNEFFGSTLPEEDIFPRFQIALAEINKDQAIKILQDFEMGRQCIHRIEKLDNKKDTDLAGELIVGDESKRLIFENLMAHFKLKKTKYDEMEIVKMLPQDKSQTDSSNNPVKFSEETREERKRIQKNNLIYYEEYKNEMREKFKLVEEDDLKENMKNERREWINEAIMFNDKSIGPPHDIKMFYDRDKVEKRVDLDDDQLKVAETIAKDKLKGKQDAKKKDEAGQMINCK